MLLLAPCAVGDALDRLTILALKAQRVAPSQRANVEGELQALRAVWREVGLPPEESVPEFSALADVNRTLWELEDRLRAAEAGRRFGEEFVADARSVYTENDRRAALKRSVNLRFGSVIVEEKVHPGYGADHG
jgi:hypothetical protein